MKKLLYITFVVILLAGCNVAKDNKELSYSEVDIGSTDKKVQEFIGEVKDENGIHLYHGSRDGLFVFLNASITKQGEEAAYFSDFDVKAETDTVNIYFKQESTIESSNKELNNQVLIEIKLDKEYELIKLFRNGEEAYFSTVSAGQ